MRIATYFIVLSVMAACGGELEINNSNGDGNTSSQTNNGTDVASNCGVDELICGGRCTDIRANEMNCGACGTRCVTGTCVDYQCNGATQNNGTVNNTTSNNGTSNNNRTTAGQTAPDCAFELCNNVCIDTTANPDHCGACTTKCDDVQVCLNSSCTTLGEIEGILVASNQARATGSDCGVYGQYDPTTPLVLDPELNKAAQAHAKDMADNNFFSHTGSDGSNFSTRIRRTNFSGQPIGENIAGGGSQPAGIVDRWIDSDGHCRNLMNPEATKLGVGYTLGGQYGTLWVQVFAR